MSHDDADNANNMNYLCRNIEVCLFEFVFMCASLYLDSAITSLNGYVTVLSYFAFCEIS